MSLVDKEIASVDGSGGGGGLDGGDGDEDEEEEEEEEEEEGGGGGSHGRCRCGGSGGDLGKKQRGISGNGFSRNFGKAKQVVLQPFTRSSKKQLPRKNKARAFSSSSAGVACFLPSRAFSAGKRFGSGSNGGGGGNKGCYFCFTQPQTLDSPNESRRSDPEHPDFTFEMLRVFMEKNDFYAKDCNPHLDIDVSSNAKD